MIEKMITFEEWSAYVAQSIPRGPAPQMNALEKVWRGWCQDQQCENHILYGLKVGDVLRVRLPQSCEPTPAR